MKRSCVIIGGGIGGLFTGAFLSKNGIEVTVLEKNEIIGGGLQCFKRKGKTFETGMHIAGGFVDGGNLNRICKYFGILDKLKIQHVPSGCIDELYYHKTKEVFKIASGREKFVDSLSIYFPEEKDNIKKYVDHLYHITSKVNLFSLKEQSDEAELHREEFIQPADELIKQYVSDEKLREILAYLNPLYSGKKGHTPAYIHALLNVLYINGASRFIGGGQQLANLLKEVIENHGGAVISDCEVTYIDITEKNVNYVEDKDGKRYIATNYISAIHPAYMAKLVTPGTFRKSFINRLNEIPGTASAFSVYIDLKPNRFKYIDHTCYYMEDFGNMWEQENLPHENGPVSFMYMTPPDENQGEYASRICVHCLMKYDEVHRWNDTKRGERGEEYEQWKKHFSNLAIDKLCNLFPNLREDIANIYSSSPLTIRDYYNSKDGAIFGYRKDCKNLIFSRLPVYTKISNLFLTGQNIILHGICGVPLTALITAEEILGRNSIIKKINDEVPE